MLALAYRHICTRLHIGIFAHMLLSMRTSLDIPDPLLRKAKALARARRTTLRQLVLEGLRKVVEQPRKGPQTLEDFSFGGKGLVDGLQWDDWDEILGRSYEGRGG